MTCPQCQSEYIDQIRIVPRNNGEASAVCKVIAYNGFAISTLVLGSSDLTLTHKTRLNFTESRWNTYVKFDPNRDLMPAPIGFEKGEKPPKKRDTAKSSTGSIHEEEDDEEDDDNRDRTPPAQKEEVKLVITDPNVIGAPIPEVVLRGLQNLFLLLDISVNNDHFMFSKRHTLRLSRAGLKLCKNLENAQAQVLNERVGSFLKAYKISFVGLETI